MVRSAVLVMLAVMLALLGRVAAAQEAGERPSGRRAGEGSPVERGKYLVHDVAMCVMCHTPHTADGRLVSERLLQGSPMPVSSPFPRQRWAFRAPALAGLGGFSEEAIVTLLQTGARPGGETPEPPMPPFRMTEEDARAVAAYLKSLR